MRARWLIGAGVLALLLVGCDTSEGDAPAGSDGGGSGTTDTGGGGSDAGTSDSTTGGDGGTGGPSAAPLSSFPNACTDAKPCASAEQMCNMVPGEDAGICVTKPKVEATITDPVAEDNTDQKPNLDCVGAALPAATGKKVRLHGFVDRFGSGGITTGITVRVYDAAKFDPSRCDGLEPAEAFACYEEVIDDKSAILGETVSTEVTDQSAEGKDCEEGGDDCPLGFECNDVNGFFQCHEQFGLFAIEGIPTNTPVVVMTAPPADEADVWHRTFLYGVAFIEDFAKGDDYRYDPTIVGDGQWKTVPNPFNTQIAPGNGAIGGRIRDCSKVGADKRPSWHIYEATVGFAKAPSITGYFNEFENDTLPVPSRTSTNILGRYVGLDVAPGANWVTGTAMIDGKAASLGSYPVYVFPSSLAVVSFPGIVPPSTAE